MDHFLSGFAAELVKHASVMGNMTAKAIPNAIETAKANRPMKTIDKIPSDAQRAPKGSETVFQLNARARKWKRLKAFAEKSGAKGGLQMPPYPGSREEGRQRKLQTPPSARLAGTKK